MTIFRNVGIYSTELTEYCHRCISVLLQHPIKQWGMSPQYSLVGLPENLVGGGVGLGDATPVLSEGKLVHPSFILCTKLLLYPSWFCSSSVSVSPRLTTGTGTVQVRELH